MEVREELAVLTFATLVLIGNLYFCHHYQFIKIYLRFVVCAQKSYFSQILIADLFTSLLYHSSSLPRESKPCTGAECQKAD